MCEDNKWDEQKKKMLAPSSRIFLGGKRRASQLNFVLFNGFLAPHINRTAAPLCDHGPLDLKVDVRTTKTTGCIQSGRY